MKNLLYILLLLFIFNGCDLLTTRTPERPNSSKSNQITAVTPEILFGNLKNAFKEKFLDNYLACFVDTVFLNKKFEFIASAAATNQYPILNNWNLNLEKQYFSNLISLTRSDAPITLNLTEIANNNFGDSAVYQFDYTIALPFTDEAKNNTFTGSAKFTIHLDRSNKWVITRWEDIQKAENPSWSKLKGEYVY